MGGHGRSGTDARGLAIRSGGAWRTKTGCERRIKAQREAARAPEEAWPSQRGLESGRCAVVVLELRQVRQEFRFAGQAAEIEADHLVGPQRRLAPRPEADQQAGDDRTVGLNLDAVGAVAEQVPAAQHVLEEPEENLDGPAETIDQR